jgi:hypothetical protein
VTYNASGREVYPTVVDAAPTALQWLGYGDEALAEFARHDFATHFKNWMDEQNKSCSSNILQMFVEALHRTDYESQYHFSVQDLEGGIQEVFTSLCKGLPSGVPPLPDFQNYKPDGNLLNLTN